MIDMTNRSEIALALSATLSGATPAAGGLIDMAGWEAVTIALHTGTVTDAGAAAGIVFELQESDTTAAADFTAVAAAGLIGAETDLTVTLDTADNVAVGAIGYRGAKRYIRLVATGSVGTDAYVAAVAIKQAPRTAGTKTVQAAIAAT